MAFGKKKATGPVVQQKDVVTLATQWLAQSRSTEVHLPLRATLTAPCLMNRWKDVDATKMLAKQVGIDLPVQPKDLTLQFEDSWYRNTDGVLAMPLRIMKACILDGTVETKKSVSAAELKRNLRVKGWCAPIHLNGELTMDIRPVRPQSGTSDIRARALVPAGSYWDFVLSFPNDLAVDKVMAAAEAAGAKIGVCEMRPAKGFELGTFQLAPLSERDIDRVVKACSVPEEMIKIPPELLRAHNAAATAAASDKARKVVALADHQQQQTQRKRKAGT